MKTPRFGPALAAVSIAVLPVLSGCIVGEIRDELKSANSQLTDVQTSLSKLDRTNEQIERTNEELIRTSQLISEVQLGLGRIDTTNTSLTAVDQRLSLLHSINTSLTHLDAHLASLRKTISSLDDSIPFLSFGGSDETIPEPTAAAAPEQQAAAPTATDAATGAESPPAASAAGTAPSRDPMIGAWITRYPDDRGAVIFAPDGEFILSRRGPDGVTTEMMGTWVREERVLKLTGRPTAATEPAPPTAPPAVPAAPAAPASAPAETGPGQPAAGEPPAPITRSIEIVMVTGRSVTVRLDGELLILVRP